MSLLNYEDLIFNTLFTVNEHHFFRYWTIDKTYNWGILHLLVEESLSVTEKISIF